MRRPEKSELHASFKWGASTAYAATSRGTKQEFVCSCAEGGGRFIAEDGLSEFFRFGWLPGRGALRISLTPVCNLRCSHSHNEGQTKPSLHRASTVAAFHDLDLLVRAAAVRSAKTMRFTCGEPGMYPHFYELISAKPTTGSTRASIGKWVLTNEWYPFSEASKISALAGYSFQW